MGRKLHIPVQPLSHRQAHYAANNPVPITLPHLTFLSRPLAYWERAPLSTKPPSTSRSPSTSTPQSAILEP